MAITSRMYQGEDDYKKIRRLLSDICRVADGTGTSPGDISIGDADWWRFNTDDVDVMERARIWLDGSGTVVALTWPTSEQTETIIHPDHRALEEETIVWSEEQRAGSTPEDGQPLELNVSAFDDDDVRIEILTRRGFERKDDHLVYRRRPTDDLPDVTLANGYQLRDMNGTPDLEQRTAAHRSAFTNSKMGVERYPRIMSAPTYRADLDLVAVAPDGTYAAFCIVWFDPVSELGVFEPVGCHADHRQRGLASAVMAEGMRRVGDLGARTVAVCARGGDVASNRLYESLGFRFVGEIHTWTKTV